MIRKLELKGLGPINNASVDFANLTLICGKNGVGKTYLSYSHYLLMGVFYKAFEEALAFPTVEAWCDTIGSADLVKVSFELDVADIKIDLGKIINEVNSSQSALLVSNELRLNENSKQLPDINAVIDDDYMSKIVPLFKNAEFESLLFKGGIIKEANSATINIELLINGKGEPNHRNIYKDLNFIIKIFICDSLLKHAHQAITSERTGISLFYKDLDDSLRKAMTTDTNEISGKKYIKPIEDNISTVRGLARRSFHSKEEQTAKNNKLDIVKAILQELVDGKYTGNDQEVLFKPSGKNNVTLSLKTASGASKSLLLIDHFVNQLTREHGMLIVDEPEMNLHLDGQKKIAQLLAALTNIGVKVVVTTHSDHFIREINNLIALSSDKINEQRREELLQLANIKPIALLKPEAISAIVIDSGTGNTNQMSITEHGIELALFNDEILASVDISNEIAYALHESDES